MGMVPAVTNQESMLAHTFPSLLITLHGSRIILGDLQHTTALHIMVVNSEMLQNIDLRLTRLHPAHLLGHPAHLLGNRLVLQRTSSPLTANGGQKNIVLPPRPTHQADIQGGLNMQGHHLVHQHTPSGMP